jgi:predicted TPR repeat methyltransferase
MADDDLSNSVGRAIGLHRAGRLDEAADVYRQVLAAQPDHIDANYLFGMLCFQQRELELALSHVAEAARLAPGNATFIADLGRIQKARGDLVEAIATLERAVVLDPQCAASWAALGDARNAADSRVEAVDAYRRAIDIAPDLAMAHNNLGVALRALRQFEPAIEAFQCAIALHGEYVDAWLNLVNTIENLDDHAVAMSALNQALESAPDALDLRVRIAYQLFYAERFEESLAQCEMGLGQSQENAELFHVRGLSLQRLGRIDAAIESYRAALAVDGDDKHIHSNLGTALRSSGDIAGATASFERALKIDPGFAKALFNLGVVRQEVGNFTAAITALEAALEIDPVYSDAYRRLASVYYAMDDHAGGVAVLRRWLESDPDNAAARHLLRAHTKPDDGQRAADDYIRHEFDAFAETFDHTLERLDYRGPGLVAKLLAEHVPAETTGLVVLDAGCGTGLCAPVLRGYARRLVGVDLSQGMVHQARLRDIYDELVVAELADYLVRSDERVDLILCADTLVYFGSLTQIMKSFAAALNPAGLLAFTVEELHGEGAQPLRLNAHGRYGHRAAYVAAEVEAAGLELMSMQHETLRIELNKPVAGLLVLARKPRLPGPG